MTSLCGHVKALIREWVMERMAAEELVLCGCSPFQPKCNFTRVSSQFNCKQKKKKIFFTSNLPKHK